MVLSDIEAFNASKPPPCGKRAEKVDDEEEVDEYSDNAVDFDDDDDEEEEEEDKDCGLGCPFCSEDFDVLGLCCHIDVAHHKEAKAAICPVCVANVDVGMTVHLITKHENILKMLCKKKIRDGGSRSALPFLKKALQDECLQTSSKGSSPVKSSAVVESDSLFLPFCYRPMLCVKSEKARPSSEASLTRNSSPECNSESCSQSIEVPSIPEKNEDNAQKSDFVKEILFSLIFEDNL